jgi:hypothetical protein
MLFNALADLFRLGPLVLQNEPFPRRFVDAFVRQRLFVRGAALVPFLFSTRKLPFELRDERVGFIDGFFGICGGGPALPRSVCRRRP